jgi:hypothetical protein
MARLSSLAFYFEEQLAPGLEESREHAACLNAVQAFFHENAVVKEIGIGKPEFAADGAETEVTGGKDEAFDAGDHQRAYAHRAWFQAYVERRSGQTVIAHASRGLAESLNFGVGRWIACGDRMIAPLPDHLVIQDKNGSDRDFPFGFGLCGEREGALHAAEVRVSPGGKNVQTGVTLILRCSV